ncbi:MAG: hypothetical protein H0V56_00980, partial [Chthoniobacterales bacterium]|nr:hypothetical protein [Chthoniobacterales bacterium]
LQHEEKKPQVFFHLGRALVAMVAENASPEARAAAYEDAIVVFRQGWQVAPLDTTFPLEIAFLYGELGRFAEAEPLYRDALTRDPCSDAVKQVYRYHQNSWQKSMRAHDAAPPGADPPPPK